MGINPLLLEYQERLVSLHATASQLRLGQMIALAIMTVAIVAILILAFVSVVKRNAPLPVSLMPLPIAVYSGFVRKSRNSALLKTLRLETFYEKGIARLEGRWANFGDAGEDLMPLDHRYGKHLDVFGAGSLFELLCTCRTDVGRRRLAEYLLRPVHLDEVARRQEAVRELKTRVALREQINLLGEYGFERASSKTITDWLESSITPVYPALRLFAFVTATLLGVLVLLGWDRAIAWSAVIPWIGTLLLFNALLGLLCRNRVLASAQAIRSIGMEIPVLRDGLNLMQEQKFSSALLAKLADDSRKGNPSIRLRNLTRLSRAFVERDKEWFYLGSRVLLIGSQAFWATEKWRRDCREDMRRWLSAWGEFEALVALANYAYEHPENTFPQLLATGANFQAENMCHPLLAAEKCIRNSVSLNRETRFYLISGSNMAGKSTLLRAIGLNAVLAYVGAPVCAETMALSRLQICASFSVQDSLLDGRSKFLAEIDRLKLALTTPAEFGAVLFLIDEILSGTNSNDRRAAVEVILRELVRQGAVGALSTHDLALTELPSLKDLQGVNMHMESKDDLDPLNFDYILKPGVTRRSSALAIARLAGVPV